MTNHLGSQEIPNKIVNKYLTDTCKPMVIVVKPSRTLWDFPGTDSSIPVSIFSYDFNFIYLILAVLGLHCCSGFCLIVVSRLFYSCGTWIYHGSGFFWQLQHAGSVVVAHRLQSSRAHVQQLWHMGLVAPMCPQACGILVAHRHVGSSWTRNLTHVFCIGRWILYH